MQSSPPPEVLQVFVFCNKYLYIFANRIYNFSAMLKQGLYACATCGLAMQDMSRVWMDIDREVAQTPMPR